MNRVAVLTPPGTGAIATVAVVGAGAWAAVRTLFRPAGRAVPPDAPEPDRFWFGTLGDGAADEVVVAVPHTDAEPRVEVHCHGGRRVVRWVVELFTSAGFSEISGWDLAKPTDGDPWTSDPRALEPLSRAPTLRTASVLLDQCHGAFARTVRDVLATLDREDAATANRLLADLARFAPLGRHLVAPWRVVIAGPPNVGKSSLVNALAGYQRSIVAPVAGTTRDAVTASVAFDGWPVELTDTAGLRSSADPLEAEGVGRARQLLDSADLVVWVVDATASEPAWPEADIGANRIVVVNKTDLPRAWDRHPDEMLPPVSAATGDGVPELAAKIAAVLVPAPPPPGSAVPFTPALADAVVAARDAFARSDASAALALRSMALRCAV